MQRTLKRRLGTGGSATTLFRRIRTSEAMLGGLVVIVALILLAAAAVLYLHPTGRKAMSFETTDAASLTVGEDVRVAGVPVGKVTKLSIRSAAVRVDTELDNDTFVGADSTVDVRMLTPVGGYAVTVVPIGDQPLGDAVIPADRVTVPYSIADVLAAVPHVTGNVDGTTIKADIDQVADGLRRNSASVSSLVAGLNSIATVMDAQRDQVDKTMALAAEYLQTFNGSREFVFHLLQQIDIVESTYDTSSAGFDESYVLLGDVMNRIIPEERFYLAHSQELVDAVAGARGAIGDFRKSLDPVLDQLRGLRAQLESWLTPQGLRALGGGTILATGLCIPVSGRTC
jgi:phospholipid/cholesterol/gamma-HCH transport system substrate-binding protein